MTQAKLLHCPFSARLHPALLHGINYSTLWRGHTHPATPLPPAPGACELLQAADHSDPGRAQIGADDDRPVDG
jgi:hypothetical protein